MVNVLGFDVAREENMSPDDPVLKLILNKLPKDKEWDANIPRESALLEANEFRHYYNKNALGSWAVEVSSSSKAEAWADKGNVKLQNLQNKLTENPDQVKRELGFEKFELAADAHEKARRGLQGKEQPCKDVLAQLAYRSLQDVALKEKHAEFKTFVENLENKLTSARALSVAAGEKVGANELDTNLQAQCEASTESLEADLVTVQSQLRKMKTLLEK